MTLGYNKFHHPNLYNQPYSLPCAQQGNILQMPLDIVLSSAKNQHFLKLTL